MPSGHLLQYVLFQSTLSMRRATFGNGNRFAFGVISIHALHEESDSATAAHLFAVRYISIHALHEESDFTSVSPHMAR